MSELEDERTKALRRGEQVNRLVYRYARGRTEELYREAVRRGYISAGQAESLLGLWLERHPYEPLEPEDDAE